MSPHFSASLPPPLLQILSLSSPPPLLLLPILSFSHRPLDVCNVYNSRQVKLLVHEKEKIEYPEFEEVFRDEDEDEDDEADDGSGGDRLERMEARVAKRQAKRNWEQNKIKILFEYEQFSFTGLYTWFARNSYEIYDIHNYNKLTMMIRIRNIVGLFISRSADPDLLVRNFLDS